MCESVRVRQFRDKFWKNGDRPVFELLDVRRAGQQDRDIEQGGWCRYLLDGCG